MAKQTYLQLQQTLAALTGLSGTDATTRYKLFLNMAGRRIWGMFLWPERLTDENIALVAPYTDGTLTTTVASTSVTGGSTVWTSGMTKRKLAQGYGSPFYRFTQTGNTTGTIDHAWVETAVTAGAYVIYQDEYDLASDCAVSSDFELNYNAWQGRLSFVGARLLDGSVFTGPWAGTPTTVALTVPQTAGVKRVRVYPIPDQAYSLRHRYYKTYTDLSADGDLYGLNINLEAALIDGAFMYAQRYQGKRPDMDEATFEAKVRQVWLQTQENEPLVSYRRSMDSPLAAEGRILDLRNIIS